MKNTSNSLASNARFVVASQLLSLVIGIVRSLFVPIILSVAGYGYWQVYLLYLPYIGFAYLGFNDGIYLRYGKYDKDQLPTAKLRSAMRIFLLMLAAEVILLLPLLFGVSDANRQIALFFVIVNIPVTGIYGTIIYILQVTNQMKKFAIYNLIDKIFFIAALFAIAFIDGGFVWVIVADVVSRLIVSLVLILSNRTLFFGKVNWKEGASEFKINITAGFTLMIASFLTLVFNGIGRIFIEAAGNIEQYATYSFGMSIINILLTFFVSMSTVLYPMLKRTDESQYPKLFDTFNKYYDAVAFIGIVAFFFGHLIITTIFQKYLPVLQYLNVLFCLALFQGKINLINNTFYKTLREEKKLMTHNIVSTVFFTFLCFLSQNVMYIAIATTVVMATRCYQSEYFLRKKLGNVHFSFMRMELLMIAVFIASTFLGFAGIVVYGVVLLVYMYTHRQAYFDLLKKAIR